MMAYRVSEKDYGAVNRDVRLQRLRGVNRPAKRPIVKVLDAVKLQLVFHTRKGDQPYLEQLLHFAFEVREEADKILCADLIDPRTVEARSFSFRLRIKANHVDGCEDTGSVA